MRVSAHQVYAVEVRHPVEVGADEADHLVTWLSRRLGLALAAPDLAGQGFELVGGRLLPAAHRPGRAADVSGRRAAAGSRSTSARAPIPRPRPPSASPARASSPRSTGATSGAAWALLGELPRDELLRLAHLVYQALQR